MLGMSPIYTVVCLSVGGEVGLEVIINNYFSKRCRY